MTDKEKLDAIRAEIHRLVDTRGYDREMANDLFAFMDSLPNEPVSDDLGDYINELSKQFPEVSFAKLSRIAVRIAKWQKQQDQSTIELAEDHAMLAGMEKMKQQMIEKAAETTFNVSLPSSLYDKLWIKGCKEGDKLLVIKKNEL